MKPTNGFDKCPENINRKGRSKKGQTYTDILQKQGEINDITTDTGEKISRKEALCKVMWTLAIQDKDVAMIKYINDRIDGMPVKKVDTTVNDGSAKLAKEWIDAFRAIE